MPNTTIGSQYVAHGSESALLDFLAREMIDLEDLRQTDAEFTLNQGIIVTDDILSEAMTYRDIRMSIESTRSRPISSPRPSSEGMARGDFMWTATAPRRGRSRMISADYAAVTEGVSRHEQVEEAVSRTVSHNEHGEELYDSVVGWGEVESSPMRLQTFEPHDAYAEEEALSFDDSDEDSDGDEDSDEDREPTFRRKIKAEDFTPYEIPEMTCTSKEQDAIINEYFKQIEYRLRWIFYREEREGFRRRQVQPFNINDFVSLVGKASKAHDLNTETSMFYDWNLGSTDFILRLESFQIDGVECMRCHFIHKPSGEQIGYQDRVWKGGTFTEVNAVWARVKF